MAKIRLVGGDQRHALAIGEIDQRRLGALLGRGAVALQFDIEPVAERREQRIEAGGGEMALPGGNREIERAARPAGERDEAVGFACEPFELEVGFSCGGVSRKAREDSRIRLR